MKTTAEALIAWTKGRPHFTPAGLRHYAEACAEVHIEFVPQAVCSSADLCKFMRMLLQASVAQRDVHAAAVGAGRDDSPLRSLAERALDEVAHTSGGQSYDAPVDLVQHAEHSEQAQHAEQEDHVEHLEHDHRGHGGASTHAANHDAFRMQRQSAAAGQQMKSASGSS